MHSAVIARRAPPATSRRKTISGVKLQDLAMVMQSRSLLKPPITYIPPKHAERFNSGTLVKSSVHYCFEISGATSTALRVGQHASTCRNDRYLPVALPVAFAALLFSASPRDILPVVSRIYRGQRRCCPGDASVLSSGYSVSWLHHPLSAR